ncbi:TPA: phosphate ABC transporter substrate-binding protein PstS, partial [Mannheimia haemolytica]|nr:phosphate ABC transporter substrate-binding protein PstS [Mannheimia haemolytica]
MIAKRFKLLTVLGISFSLSVAANAQTITGAGASFPYPIYAKWAGLYEK